MPLGPERRAVAPVHSERGFERETRTYAVRARGPIALAVQAAALPVIPADRVALAAAVLVALAAWTAVMVLVRDPGAHWVLGVDVAALGAICLAQPRLDAPLLVQDQCGWVPFAVEIAVITYQWQFAGRRGLVAGGALSIAYGAGALLAGERPAVSVGTAVWIFLTGLMSVSIYRLLLLGVQRTDEAAVAAEQARRDVQVAEARRRSEAEHLSTLHDTVAATLMMVGLGLAERDPAALRRQAERDLAVLSASPGQGEPEPELVAALRLVEVASGLQVELVTSGPEPHLPAAVTAALTGAAGEALRNVTRHSGTTRARLEVHTGADEVCVTIRDGGRGFDPGSRHGRGIRLSILERMSSCGGRAVVRSSPEGVTVRLHWPADRLVDVTGRAEEPVTADGRLR